uniref:Acetylcholine receptor subunit alpha-type unc-63 n=1 Tax=Syphacia muris TaxID=451379 RepID=A0A0N5AHD7_9BILA
MIKKNKVIIFQNHILNLFQTDNFDNKYLALILGTEVKSCSSVQKQRRGQARANIHASLKADASVPLSDSVATFAASIQFLDCILACILVESIAGDKYAEQLYEDLLYNYEKNVRPVRNASKAVEVEFGASLIRIIDVDEVNQVLTTSLWMELKWNDYRFRWDPAKFNGIEKLHIPSDQIWTPDIILYTNADGEPHISITSDALVHYTGAIVWKPPSIYKSFCEINIEYFPYDIQTCLMKFGGWAYDGFALDVRQALVAISRYISELQMNPTDVIRSCTDSDNNQFLYLEQGMDLSSYYPSAEWDLISLSSHRHEQSYPGCCGQNFWMDVTYEIVFRRKTLFYTVNLVIPCVLIAIITTFVFLIPPCEHKMTFTIMILVSLSVFYLVLVELIPPTSLVIPLIGKYLLFTMVLVWASIVSSVIILNTYRRDASAQALPRWKRVVFLQFLPKYLCMKPPDNVGLSEDGSSISDVAIGDDSAAESRRSSPYLLPSSQFSDGSMRLSQLAQLRGMHPDLIRRMIDNVSFISDYFRALKKADKVSEDWSYVAMVMDRLLFILFTSVNLIGTLAIFLHSPISLITLLIMFYGFAAKSAKGNRFAEQLYEDLLYKYDKNVRPVKNSSSPVKVKFGASLIRIIDVDEVNQVLTTNLLMQMQWYDYRFVWDPSKWNGIRKLHFPSDQIWIPDIVLYTNADGEPHVSIMSDALVLHNGMVIWRPPSIYKSFCPINIEYFPYDQQNCVMKFGGWSYHGFLLDVQQLPTNIGDEIQTKRDKWGNKFQFLEDGMDLSSYYVSGEWDLINLTSRRHEQLYPGCCGQDFYIDVSFVITIRRKTLFYTVNLVIPCALIAVLTTVVFYIPAFEHKMTLSISIFVSLTLFYIVLVELIPPTSLVVPLIAKYLLFTLFLVTLSILISVHIIRMYRRDATAYPLPRWMRNLFLSTLPKYIFIKPPETENNDANERNFITGFEENHGVLSYLNSSQVKLHSATTLGNIRLKQLAQLRGMHPDLIRRMIDNVSFISDYFRAIKKERKIAEDWSHVAMVVDRLLLMIFSLVNLIGTLTIFLLSPTLKNYHPPMTVRYPTTPFTVHSSRLDDTLTND